LKEEKKLIKKKSAPVVLAEIISLMQHTTPWKKRSQGSVKNWLFFVRILCWFWISSSSSSKELGKLENSWAEMQIGVFIKKIYWC